MNLEGYKNIYFIGIGGIGMSALATYFYTHGKNISGYDKTPSANTKMLQSKGISIVFEDNIEGIGSGFMNATNTLVVYTPAISKENFLFNYFLTHKFKILKRADVLGLITKDSFCMAVAGTHGKTTTSSILGHLLHASGEPVTAFLGGISENYNSNLILGNQETTVVEADEFDRSFLALRPNYACITSTDADHLDIYGKKETLDKAFKDFAQLLPNDGHLYVHHEVPMEGITYGVETQTDYAAVNVVIRNGTYYFDLETPKKRILNFQFTMPGVHNLSNAVVALAMALDFGCKEDLLRKALKEFKGVRRRFSYIIKSDQLVFIDDYAHHPKEIRSVRNAISQMHPGKSVTAVFQPHLFSRTQDFANEFAEALSDFEAVLLLDIYPAREVPIDGVTSSWLLSKIRSNYKKCVSKSALSKTIKGIGNPVLVTMGAGDIGSEVEQLKQHLAHE